MINRSAKQYVDDLGGKRPKGEKKKPRRERGRASRSPPLIYFSKVIDIRLRKKGGKKW